MQVNTSARSARCSSLTPPMSEMYVAPGARLVAGRRRARVYWKIPFLPPVELQLATEPSPAPMSDEMTATWMLGSPPRQRLSVS